MPFSRQGPINPWHSIDMKSQWITSLKSMVRSIDLVILLAGSLKSMMCWIGLRIPKTLSMTRSVGFHIRKPLSIMHSITLRILKSQTTFHGGLNRSFHSVRFCYSHDRVPQIHDALNNSCILLARSLKSMTRWIGLAILLAGSLKSMKHWIDLAFLLTGFIKSVTLICCWRPISDMNCPNCL